MKIIGSVALLVALSGCTTAKVIELNKVDERTGQSPELLQESSVTVGSPVFSQFKYWSKVGYRLKQDLTIYIGGGRVAVSDGDFLVKAEAEGELAYCTENGAFFSPFMGYAKTACFVDENNDWLLEKVKVASDVVWWDKQISPAIKFEKSELIIQKDNAKREEILYHGYSGNTLRLSYREYINDMARPAFFQDASYDITAFPAEITFKTVRLQVMSAGNNGMRYKVLSGF